MQFGWGLWMGLGSACSRPVVSGFQHMGLSAGIAQPLPTSSSSPGTIGDQGTLAGGDYEVASRQVPGPPRATPSPCQPCTRVAASACTRGVSDGPGQRPLTIELIELCSCVSVLTKGRQARWWEGSAWWDQGPNLYSLNDCKQLRREKTEMSCCGGAKECKPSSNGPNPDADEVVKQSVSEYYRNLQGTQDLKVRNQQSKHWERP